ncbi:MAG: restriction endonuclease subunit S [Salinivirgaceae bacterium]|nr:restriction endonuclease subunit S [Salinivirgaceae bacterium]
MKLERFFEKFDLFAEAPDAVTRMREVILWSAFSGVFSPGERNQSMPKEWGINDAPVFFSIPSSWEWKRGCDIFDVIRGVTYKKEHASDAQVEGYFPLLRANNIGNGINFDNLVYVPRENVRDEQFIRLGDILIAMSSGSKKLVGKAAPILTNNFVGSFGAFCGIIRNKSSVLDGMLAQYFQSPQYTLWVTEAGRGIGINNLSKGDLNALPVPIPPPNEQNRIVAKVEELMALCDQLEAQQQERQARHAALVQASLARFTQDPTPDNLQFLFHPSYTISPADLRKTILTLAFQGKLVPQDPNDEPVEDLMARLELEQRQFAAKHQYRLPTVQPVDTGALPFDVPGNWMWCRLNSIFNAITDGDHLPPPKTNSGIAFLTIGNITTGKLFFEGCRFVPESYYKKLAGFRRPIRGDILYTVVGATYGRSALVETDRPFCVQRHIAILKPPQSVAVGFLMLLLRSPLTYKQATGNTTGTAQPTIPLGSLRNFVVPIPPLAEQRRIVAKVDELLALVDELETQLVASRTVAQNLLAALVRELTTTP